MKTMRYEHAHLPTLSQEQRAELAVLAALPDDAIDCNDIPVLSDVAWANAVQGRFYKAIKKPLTVRLDADVLAWLKSQGKGYQTRMNSILREAMQKDVRKS
ncbi:MULTISPECIES: BrnA antitoxin family protein [unclassified Undibacterium]|uniref:BrnA antitoxin family protein n=1 Tax=unclassified Undibacterium TaxID=2630295 RepID=UPI002AC9EA0C|nr:MULTISPECIES: BrnA antitoxin family protein [unclassified Undibacterium]MEB0137408.1 BrnA antitoxin family protein [Undibacterium sp. CCC2.1]MEB0170927.1 BrnA antitoxin family protein [Undibacterium sp. CCC1.1]MEB0174879.1 BrnA antitoxin family protein [Undibacterium sp. CCC3.4]MEB0214215.1 BrnA antitoxin family protein [Undibacterium sp. 5I2]WPX44526.1 BrnA antitoxin family protein [Undibacterium sp. CCC3.4]